MTTIFAFGIATMAISSNMAVYQRLARPIDYLIVRAEVIQVHARSANSADATLRILHAFSPERELVGTTFHDSYRMQDIRGRASSRPFKVGEQGLWSVDASGTRIVAVRDLPFKRRSRPGYDPRHASIERLAGRIEKLLSIPIMNRSQYARELMFDHVPEVSIWFTRFSCSFTPTEELYRLTFPAPRSRRVPYSSQIVIDEALASRMPHDWPASADRKKMLVAWVSSVLDDYYAQLVLTRLDLAVQSQQLRVPDAVDLVTKAALNKAWNWPVRRNAVLLVGRLTQDELDGETGYEWLIGQIRSNADIEMRRAAALAIRNYVTLYPGRLNTVNQLLDKEKDTNVSEWLREASQKSK